MLEGRGRADDKKTGGDYINSKHKHSAGIVKCGI